MKSKTEKQDWKKGSARHLLRLVQEGLNLLDAYFTGEENIEIIIDRMRVGHEILGPVSYDFVIQAYESLDECLGQLGAFVTAGDVPRRDFEKLIYQRNILTGLCENKRKNELELESIA